MNFHKSKIKPDGSLDKLKLIILVRGDFQNNDMVGDTWDPISSTRMIKYLLADAYKHKTRVHQLDLIGAFLQSNAKHSVFVKLGIRYG